MSEVTIVVNAVADTHERVILCECEREQILKTAISAAHDVAIRYMDDPAAAADAVMAASLAAVTTLNRRCAPS